jgi:hypothetical protein
MADDELIDRIVRLVALDGDLAFLRASGSTAQRMREFLRAALTAAQENRLITIVPADQWPEYVITPGGGWPPAPGPGGA